MGKSWIAALLAALTAFPFFAISPAATASPATEYRCLAVGIDRFVNEENTAPCSANNTEGIAALFGDCLPEGTKVTRRVNGPGSAEEMERLILDTFREAGEEDTSYLYLSTHGVTWEEEDTEKAALIIRPPEDLRIGHMEKNPEELERVYQIGRQEAGKRLSEIRQWLEIREE